MTECSPSSNLGLPTSEGCLLVEHLGEIDRVRLNRPHRLNALNHNLAEALLAYFESKRRDDTIRVIPLCALGEAFALVST